jgi:hypothetical protein
MRTKRMLLPIVLSLLVAVIAANVAFAQGQAQDKQQGQFKTTIKGKIGYLKQLGGYYVQGVEPGGEWIILNKNPKVLKKLKESQKTVTIEGSLRAPEYLTIEKIDGKPYSGTPASK